MKFEASITIDRPPDDVFAFVADPMQEARWAPVVDEVRMTSDGAVGVGSTYDEDIHFLGRRYTVNFEVLEYEPPRTMNVRMSGGPAKLTGLRLVEPANGGSRLTVRTEGPSGLFFGVIERLVGWAARRRLTTALATVKKILEGT